MKVAVGLFAIALLGVCYGVASDEPFRAGAQLTHFTVGEASTLGDYPRSFTIDPTSSFLYVCNQRSDSVTTFALDGDGGKLKFTGQYTAIGSPAVMVFL